MHLDASLGISLDFDKHMEPLSFLVPELVLSGSGSPAPAAGSTAAAASNLGKTRPRARTLRPAMMPASPGTPYDALEQSPAFSLSGIDLAEEGEGEVEAQPVPAPFAQNGFMYFAVPMFLPDHAEPEHSAPSFRSRSLPNFESLPAELHELQTPASAVAPWPVAAAGKRRQEGHAPGPSKRRDPVPADAPLPALLGAPADRARPGWAPADHALVLSGSVNSTYLERIQKHGVEGKFLPPWLVRPVRGASPAVSPSDSPRGVAGGAAEHSAGSAPAPAPAPAPVSAPLHPALSHACNFATFSRAGGKLETVTFAIAEARPRPPAEAGRRRPSAGPPAAPAALHPFAPLAIALEPPPFIELLPGKGPVAVRPAPVRPVALRPAPVYKGALPFELDEGRAKLQQQVAAERAGAAAPPPGGSAPAMPPSGSRVTREELVANFEHPIQDVARRLGVCVTVLKKICRSHGITRWPQRKLRSVTRWTEQADVVLQNRVPGFDHAAIASVAARLRETRSTLYRNPAASIRDVTGLIRKLLVQPIQQRLNEMRAAAGAGAGRDEPDGEGSDAEEASKSGGVQMEDIATYLQSYLAAATGSGAPAPVPAPAADCTAPDAGPGPAGLHA
eukprot:tig00000754_g3909.t1